MAAYQSELYAKNSIISVIRLLAQKLDLDVSFENLNLIPYGDLVILRDNLLNQYNNQFFEEICAKELGFK